jgi:undecaprenyl-diphosphatase
MSAADRRPGFRLVVQQRNQPGRPGGVAAGTAAWLLAGTVVVLGVLTAALAMNVRPLDQLDHTVARWGYRATYGHDALSAWWRGVAAYGHPMTLRACLALAAAVLAWKRYWALAIWLVGVTVAENLFAPLSKHVLNRPRPDWLHPITVEHSLSYPSGHAAAAGTFAAAVILLSLATAAAGWRRQLVILFVLLASLVISADRIFLGVHYLSDVIAGNLLGVSIALAGWLLMLRRVRAPRGCDCATRRRTYVDRVSKSSTATRPKSFQAARPLPPPRRRRDRPRLASPAEAWTCALLDRRVSAVDVPGRWPASTGLDRPR